MPTIELEDAIYRADAKFKDFRGLITEYESAIGALLVGRHLGWRVLLLMHDRRTIAKYEKILGVNFRENLPEEGPLAKKSIVWTGVKAIRGLYWRVVRGEHHVPDKQIVKKI